MYKNRNLQHETAMSRINWQSFFPSDRKSSVQFGLVVGLVLIGLFLAVELSLGRFPMLGISLYVAGEFRMAIVHCIITSYLLGSIFYLYYVQKATYGELVGKGSVHYRSKLFERKWIYIIAVLLGLAIAIGVPFLTDETPWTPDSWEPEIVWHRLLGIFQGVSLAVLNTMLWLGANVNSKAALRKKDFDLLNINSFACLARLGLVNALIPIIFLSIFCVFLFESNQLSTVLLIAAVTLPMAIFGVWLPIRGAHEAMQQKKESELDWLKKRIAKSRTELEQNDNREATGLADASAYYMVVQAAPTWPAYSSTWMKLLFYLLIPVVSWAGGTLIQTALNFLVV